MTVSLFGVRHHGPGSARGIARALAELEPDIVLIEGPPDADGVLHLAARPELQPPVAILVYAPKDPTRALSYPLARFSPEWQAITYATQRDVPLRFIDLPGSIQLANQRTSEPSDDADEDAATPGAAGEPSEPVHHDPLRWLAEAAGYGDPERWWEDVVEHRAASPFEQVAAAMTALREHAPPPPDASREAQREAHMRNAIRTATKQGHQRIAVVCGAWHVPALATLPTAKSDNELLKGLPKIPTTATWIPWTYGRLAYASGYGAGVTSPGWYDHVFSTTPDDLVPRWLATTARLLRERDLDAPSASVIEAVRLTDALAALRGRPSPGLDEALDATLTVLCAGADAPLALVREQLVVGERLGSVPDDTPAIPLQQDLALEQKRVRLKPDALAKVLDLDQRKPLDLERSRLLHRLALLDVHWGEQQHHRGASLGTFHEWWELQWRPELAIALIDASRWGTTVASAATARALDAATTADRPAELTALIEQSLDADLPEAVDGLVQALAERSAVDRDIEHLMDAVPALARILRYGNVRNTDAEVLDPIVRAMVTHISIGLSAACASLDDDAVDLMLQRIDRTSSALGLLADPEMSTAWTTALAQLSTRVGLHPRLAGRLCRLLLDGGTLDAHDAAIRLSHALSRGATAEDAAAWIDGFVSGSGLVLVHDATLLDLLDTWLGSHDDAAFLTVLPLLRRSFSTFAAGERRMIGTQLQRRHGGSGHDAGGAPPDASIDDERGRRALPAVARMLGRDLADVEAWVRPSTRGSVGS